MKPIFDARARGARFSPLALVALLWTVLFLPGCRNAEDRGAPDAPALGGDTALTVSYLDVGQGDAELLQTASGKNILIDTGAAEGREALLNALRDRGVRRLDLLIVSHPHLDHFGNVPQVLAAVPTTEVLDVGLVTGSPGQERMLKAIKQHRVKLTLVSRGLAGASRDLGDGVTLRLLEPRAPLLKNTDSDPNNNSIVCLVTVGDVRFLFTGDMEEEEREKRLYPGGEDIRADIYKVAHHGSRNGTDDPFMARVQPREAVISCGVGNEYGHPHPETLAALERANARVWRTDTQGTIVVTTDGERYMVAALGKSADAPEPGNGPPKRRRSRRGGE